MHHNIKARQNYKATEMPTVVENIRKEKNANLCYVEDAILGNRPFKIAPGFEHFKVDEHSWTYDWSEEKRQKHLREFHEALPVATTPPRGGIYSQQNELGLEESREGHQQDPEGGESPPEETREMCKVTSKAHSL